MNESTSKNYRCEAISQIISSVAEEQSSLASILSAEANKINYITENNHSIQDVLNANKSVEKMINAITKLEVILSSKLDLFGDCLCVDCDNSKQGYSMLSMTVESENGGRIERDENLVLFRYYPGTTGTTIKFITEPETVVTLKSGMPSELTFENNKLVIPNNYKFNQTYQMIFTVGEGDSAYDITLLNVI